MRYKPIPTGSVFTGIIILFAGIATGILFMHLFTGKNPKKDKVEISHNLIVEKIESMGNLEVLKYNIRDVMEYKKIRKWLPNAKTALVVAGEVIVCIDLNAINPEDIYTSGDSIRIWLPEPDICHVKIDHKNSHIYNMEYGWWEAQAIADEAYRAAEQQLYDRAHQLNFMDESRKNALFVLEPLLKAMGFKDVYITYRNYSSGY
jgi:hypothetical protein